MGTKEDYLKEIKELEIIKNDKECRLSEYGKCRLETLKKYENLILFGVNRSLPTNTEPFSLIIEETIERANVAIDALEQLSKIRLPKAPL